MIFLIDINNITSILLETLQNSAKTIYVISEKVYLYLREQNVKVDMVYINVDHIYFTNGYCVDSMILVGDTKLIDVAGERANKELLLKKCSTMTLMEYIEEETA